MKRIFIVAMVYSCYGFYILADDIISKLGISEQTAQTYIINNIVADYTNGFEEDAGGDANSISTQLKEFRIPYAKLLPDILKGDKTKAAQDLCLYIKAYTNSDAFKKDYILKREKAKPTSEPWRPDDNTIKSQEEQLMSTEKELAKLKAAKMVPEATLKTMVDALAQQKQDIAKWKDPTLNKTSWEKKYPADPSVAVRNRLNEYLAIAASVDFNAQLTPPDKYGKKKFVKPEYEKQTIKWKAIYRSGKEVNTAVTAFIKDWLKQ